MEIAGEPSLVSNGLGTGGIFAFEVYALVLLVQRLPVEPLDQLEEAAGVCLPVHVADMFPALAPLVFSKEIRFSYWDYLSEDLKGCFSSAHLWSCIMPLASAGISGIIFLSCGSIFWLCRHLLPGLIF